MFYSNFIMSRYSFELARFDEIKIRNTPPITSVPVNYKLQIYLTPKKMKLLK